MVPDMRTASHPILDELSDALQHVVTTLNEKWEETPVRVASVRTPDKPRAERIFRLDGPESMSLQVRFAVYPLGDGTHELFVDLEEGPTCRFTYDVTKGSSTGETERERLGRKVTAVLLREIEPHLGRADETSGSGHVSAATRPLLVLDEEGAIEQLNAPALDVLDYADASAIDPNFFSHVHGQNLREVMRDLARMVRQDTQRARWLLRLQTGVGRWRWYRARVRNCLDSDGTIHVALRALERH